MEDIDRRHFLKLSAATVAGIATGEALLPLAEFTALATERLTKRMAGNAGIVEEKCGDAEDKRECIGSIKLTEADKVFGIVYAPALEELLFRALPSFILDRTKGVKCGKALLERHGTQYSIINGGLKMSRREIVVGVLSSAIFGGVHNFTRKGFDTETLPIPQTIGGFPLWYLQRKFGFASNWIAHAYYNFRAMQ